MSPPPNEQPKKLAKSRIASSDLRERLRLNDAKLIDEVAASTTRLLADEASRLARIEAKAASLLTAIGVSVTVAFGFGASTLLRREGLLKSSKFAFLILAVGVGLAFLFAVKATLNAIKCVETRGNPDVDEESIYEAEVLEKADGLQGPTEPACYYKRHTIALQYELYCAREDIANEKASFLAHAQESFRNFVFSLGLLFVCLLLVTLFSDP